MAKASKGSRRAVALRYDSGQDDAPRVVATGQGHLAERIVETARDAGVPVQEDAELTEALSQVQLGEAIPESLFPVVAELLVFVSRMNRQRGKDLKS